MVKRRIEEKPLVVELEVFVWLANAALAKRQELLALGESPHSHGPFFESNRHISVKGRDEGDWQTRAAEAERFDTGRETEIVRGSREIS
jgi:hypothetical protein